MKATRATRTWNGPREAGGSVYSHQSQDHRSDRGAVRGPWDPARVIALPDGYKARPGGEHDQRVQRSRADVRREWDSGDSRYMPQPVLEAGFRAQDHPRDVPHFWFSEG